MLDSILWWACSRCSASRCCRSSSGSSRRRSAIAAYAFAKPLALVGVRLRLVAGDERRRAPRIGARLAIALVALAAVVALSRPQRPAAAPASSGETRRCSSLLSLVFALVRALSPEIFGAEKYMDFAFFNTLLRSAHLPPEDPWMAGAPVNYYYFGYLLFANLARILEHTPAKAAFAGAMLESPREIREQQIAEVVVVDRRAESQGSSGGIEDVRRIG